MEVDIDKDVDMDNHIDVDIYVCRQGKILDLKYPPTPTAGRTVRHPR